MTRAKSTTTQQPVSDDHLTDHEWRLKMAAEGKAYYLPGKTVSESIAAEAERQTRAVPCTINLTEEEWRGLDTAIPDVLDVMSDVMNVFSDLSYADDLDKPGINSILRLAGRAVRSMGNNEMQLLDRLDTAVRSARKVA